MIYTQMAFSQIIHIFRRKFNHSHRIGFYPLPLAASIASRSPNMARFSVGDGIETGNVATIDQLTLCVNRGALNILIQSELTVLLQVNGTVW